MTNFLPVPSKQGQPLPDLGPQLLSYISSHFRDAHPDAFKKDVDVLVAMRREWVNPKAEAHPEIARGLMRYHAQLAFVATKFPPDIGISFTYSLPFPPPYSLSEASISLPSFTYERASVLYNIGAIYASLAAFERRAEAEGIKRALNFLTTSAGVLDYLIKTVLPILRQEAAQEATAYDMGESFLTTIREFVLAEAQECYWQQAVLQGSYKNALIAKLSMKVSDYYKSALKAANSAEMPSASYFPQAWINHMNVKSLHFEAAAQYRLSQEDLEKCRYGDEIARLRVAEGLAKKAHGFRKGVAESVMQDLKNLGEAVKPALERAVRENDLLYLAAIPTASQLLPIVGVGMVKVVTPTEVAEPIAWLMSGNAGMGPLFSALVPYGVHLALSIYDDRKDTLIRDIDGKREELDGVAASTLQSLNLPGSLQALERPVGLPPSLLKKAQEVEAAGGVDKIRALLMDVNRLSKYNGKVLSEAFDILDQEAHETEQLLERHPQLAETSQPSHVANATLIANAGQYDTTLKSAAASDATVRAKWEEWKPMIEILSGGEDIIADHVPSTTSGGGYAALPTAVRPLRASLEAIEDRIAHRAALVAETRQLADHDDVRPAVLQEAARLAHGGSGDVKPEWFEGIFEKSFAKYDKLRDDMAAEQAEQDALLEQIRQQNDAFLAERKEDPRVKDRERQLQAMDMAYWKWREIADNAEEGLKFYNSLAELLLKFKDSCSQFLNGRRFEVGQGPASGAGGGVGQLANQLGGVGLDSGSNTTTPSPPVPSPPPHQQPYSPPPQSFSPPNAYSTPSGRYAAPSSPPHHQSFPSPPVTSPGPAFAPAAPPPPPKPSAPSFSLPHPSSAQWTSGADLLPPPPPIIRSGGLPTRPAPAPPTTPQRSSSVVDTPRRQTRSQARKGPIGDPDNNPYKKGERKGGEGVI